MTPRDWGKFGIFAAVTGALMLVDQPVQHWGVYVSRSSKTVTNVSHYITNAGSLYEMYTLAALGAYDFIFKNEKVKTTNPAGRPIVKYQWCNGRSGKADHSPRPALPQRSNDKRSLANLSWALLQAHTHGKGSGSSFPSGHTTAAFSAATMYAMEYRDKPPILVLAYSAASLIGLSRINYNKHWATDVLTDAALGYLCGRQVVNNDHRYAKLKAPTPENEYGLL